MTPGDAARPLVSVMIGAYNTARYIGEAIDSVLAQTYRPLELIVVDDGSTDGTAHVIAGYADDVTYVYQSNAGNGAARNTAVRHASGELFAFLDADDRFVRDKLDRQWSALTDPALDMVFGQVREFVSPELTDAERRAVRSPADRPMPWTAPNLMLIRREAFLRVGPFDEALRVGVTVDWFARAQEAQLRYGILPAVVLERRIHTQNNGLRESAYRAQYLHVLKAALDRRRVGAAASDARSAE